MRMRRGCSTSRSGSIRQRRRRFQRSIGAGGFMRRRIISRRGGGQLSHDRARVSALFLCADGAAAAGGAGECARRRRQPQLDRFQPPPVPQLEESFPADSPHLAKARLVANAGLNDYIAREIAADPDSGSWSALAEAQIYASYGETFRAHARAEAGAALCRDGIDRSIPLGYWRILFPEPWWERSRRSRRRKS